jgi:hypothetical protein
MLPRETMICQHVRGFVERVGPKLCESKGLERFDQHPRAPAGVRPRFGDAPHTESRDIRPLILSRQEAVLAQRDEKAWVLNESAMPYSAEMGSKNAPKVLN